MDIDVAQILGIGGPTGLAGFVLALLIKAYFESKKDRREQQQADVQEETGVISNTKSVLDLVGAETARMAAKIIALERERDDAEAKARLAEGEKLEAQRNERFIRMDLEKVTAELNLLRGNGPGAA